MTIKEEQAIDSSIFRLRTMRHGDTLDPVDDAICEKIIKKLQIILDASKAKKLARKVKDKEKMKK